MPASGQDDGGDVGAAAVLGRLGARARGDVDAAIAEEYRDVDLCACSATTPAIRAMPNTRPGSDLGEAEIPRRSRALTGPQRIDRDYGISHPGGELGEVGAAPARKGRRGTVASTPAG
ncbi:hypothetical protein [Mycobacterium saskatchewanense]|uniref:hypothetical protein n=1 Tax=Mycobacterium saskatchewanense TaxID=220927 RepID=UPI0013021C12|nr:hypothetical protein [Mycobacterium saskatchewanense]